MFSVILKAARRLSVKIMRLTSLATSRSERKSAWNGAVPLPGEGNERRKRMMIEAPKNYEPWNPMIIENPDFFSF